MILASNFCAVTLLNLIRVPSRFDNAYPIERSNAFYELDLPSPVMYFSISVSLPVVAAESFLSLVPELSVSWDVFLS